MSRISDEILNKEAQKLVEAIDRDFEPQEARQSQNGEVIDIKLAKAKSGARRHINRTVRICAVAAVLMIGIVCALFIGAKNHYVIRYESEAYLWRNNAPDAENQKVKIKFDLRQVDVWGRGDKTSYSFHEAGPVYKGKITITDLDGNVLYNFCHIYLFLHKTHWKYPGGTLLRYYDEDCTEPLRDEEGRRISRLGGITFNEGMSQCSIMIYEGTDRLWEHEDGATNGDLSNGLFVTTGVSNRKDAVEYIRSIHDCTKEYAEKYGVFWDEESQSYYK